MKEPNTFAEMVAQINAPWNRRPNKPGPDGSKDDSKAETAEAATGSDLIEAIDEAVNPRLRKRSRSLSRQ